MMTNRIDALPLIFEGLRYAPTRVSLNKCIDTGFEYLGYSDC